MAWLTPLSVISANSWTRPDLTGATWARFDIPHPSPDQLGSAFLIAGLIAAAVVAVGSAFTTASRRLARLAATVRLERVLADTGRDEPT